MLIHFIICHISTSNSTVFVGVGAKIFSEHSVPSAVATEGGLKPPLWQIWRHI